MNKEIMSALLGRSLTPIEDTNYELYLKIARESLDDLLCMNLCDKDDPKTYDGHAGYSTVFTDIFFDIDTVTLNGDVVEAADYSIRQWDRRGENLNWYNSIIFDHKLCKDDEIVVSAAWGFNKMPSDLQLVLASIFGLITKKNKFDGTVSSKRVEDFQITFNVDADLDDEFYKNYNKTITKYSLCTISRVDHGKVC